MSALEKLHYVGKQAAAEILRQYDTIPPFGIILDRNGDPVTHYPDSSQLADSSDAFGSMCNLVLDYLQAAADQGEATALALVTEMGSGDQIGFAVQVEVPGTVRLLLYPCRRQGSEWIVEEPIQDESGAILFDEDAFPFWK
ncbi:hypothetical protein [Blastopirellula marina]|uniref:Uncharacterized protein n=1 Tax=Blastopirellula marina TaxID=124 RepID=A0A2S8GTA1_9BACT|nr:hypothetical protein [Blastopirellula marina]PQO47655.1 hypothetical protein C5Y93_03085 [Blastopirellula marina]